METTLAMPDDGDRVGWVAQTETSQFGPRRNLELIYLNAARNFEIDFLGVVIE